MMKASMATALLVLLGAWVARADDRAVFVEGGVYKPFFQELGEGPRPVKPLMVDRLPVTNADYRRFLEEHPEWRRSKVKKIFADASYLRHWQGDSSFEPTLAQHPVVNVSWFAARKFCEAGGQRLLTVAEWEFVADANAPKSQELILAWYAKTDDRLRPVGGKEPNRFGLEDMHGLVWEWVEDFASVIIAGDARDSNDAAGAKFCGSGSLSAKNPAEYATFMRFAFRSSLKGAFSAAGLGFRCARDANSEEISKYGKESRKK